MNKSPKLIVMLTYNDITVKDASSIFEACKNTKAEYFGIKEKGINKNEIIKLIKTIKDSGKKTVFEIVAYEEEECLSGVHLAKECESDMIMGTVYYPSVHEYCMNNNIKYMPFTGIVSGRPSVLEGSCDEIINEAKSLAQKGVMGFDLLAYRYKGDGDELCRRFISEVNTEVCIAGGIDSFEKIERLKIAAPTYFTIGSAFFDKKFGSDFPEQINKVLEYL